MRFVPRASGQIAVAFAAGYARLQSRRCRQRCHKLRGSVDTMAWIQLDGVCLLASNSARRPPENLWYL